MKFIYQLIFLLLLLPVLSNAQSSLEGKVTDKKTGEPIVGAAVYIPDTRTGVITDLDGHYSITQLPSRKLMVQVKLIGYGVLTEMIDLSTTHKKDFLLSETILEKSEVVVTGSAFTTDHARSSLSIEPLEKKQLQTVGATNITDAIAQIPGVSGITTGGGISKPVIRGLGYNRIVTVNEGLRQEGQQWGDEHGLEIDQFSADRIEVLKGPASLMYGSDALGGVINILEPVPAAQGTIQAEVNSQYSTNNKMSANSLMAEGNQKGFVWRIRGTYKDAGAYKTPQEAVYNSAFNEQNGNLMLGLNRKWGYQHVHISSYHAKFGLIEGERDSASGQFLSAIGEIIPNGDAYMRRIDLPFQKVDHLKISSVGSYFIGKGNLRTVIGWQQNDRREFSESANIPGLYFRLNTISADLKYYFNEIKGIELVAGISALHQENENKGDEFLIPEYTMQEGGGFVSAKKNFNRWTVNAGARMDFREVRGKQLDTLFNAFHTNVSAVSASAGTTYEVNEQLHLKFNVGRGFRAPNISELAANGIHEGTFRFELGNTDLKPETSLQWDLGMGYESGKAGAELSLFYNSINDFIYYRNSGGETKDVDGIDYPVYRYVQGNSVLYGAEFMFDYHITDPLHFENKIAYVIGENKDQNTALPFVPPLHWNSELSYAIIKKSENALKQLQVKAMLDVYAKQDRIDSFETETKGATVFGASINADIKIGKTLCSLFVLGNNLGDVTYYNHLSRLKDARIASMGRNITFGLTIPLAIKN